MSARMSTYIYVRVLMYMKYSYKMRIHTYITHVLHLINIVKQAETSNGCDNVLYETSYIIISWNI